MTRVQGIHGNVVTPQVILQKIADELESYEEIYVVTVDREGTFGVVAAGTNTTMVAAGAILQEVGLKAIRGD